MNGFRKIEGPVGELAKKLVSSWKDLASSAIKSAAENQKDSPVQANKTRLLTNNNSSTSSDRLAETLGPADLLNVKIKVEKPEPQSRTSNTTSGIEVPDTLIKHVKKEKADSPKKSSSKNIKREKRKDLNKAKSGKPYRLKQEAGGDAFEDALLGSSKMVKKKKKLKSQGIKLESGMVKSNSPDGGTSDDRTPDDGAADEGCIVTPNHTPDEGEDIAKLHESISFSKAIYESPQVKSTSAKTNSTLSKTQCDGKAKKILALSEYKLLANVKKEKASLDYEPASSVVVTKKEPVDCPETPGDNHPKQHCDAASSEKTSQFTSVKLNPVRESYNEDNTATPVSLSKLQSDLDHLMSVVHGKNSASKPQVAPTNHTVTTSLRAYSVDELEDKDKQPTDSLPKAYLANSNLLDDSSHSKHKSENLSNLGKSLHHSSSKGRDLDSSSDSHKVLNHSGKQDNKYKTHKPSKQSESRHSLSRSPHNQDSTRNSHKHHSSSKSDVTTDDKQDNSERPRSKSDYRKIPNSKNVSSESAERYSGVSENGKTDRKRSHSKSSDWQNAKHGAHVSEYKDSPSSSRKHNEGPCDRESVIDTKRRCHSSVSPMQNDSRLSDDSSFSGTKSTNSSHNQHSRSHEYHSNSSRKQHKSSRGDSQSSKTEHCQEVRDYWGSSKLHDPVCTNERDSNSVNEAKESSIPNAHGSKTSYGAERNRTSLSTSSKLDSRHRSHKHKSSRQDDSGIFEENRTSKPSESQQTYAKSRHSKSSQNTSSTPHGNIENAIVKSEVFDTVDTSIVMPERKIKKEPQSPSHVSEKRPYSKMASSEPISEQRSHKHPSNTESDRQSSVKSHRQSYSPSSSKHAEKRSSSSHKSHKKHKSDSHSTKHKSSHRDSDKASRNSKRTDSKSRKRRLSDGGVDASNGQTFDDILTASSQHDVPKKKKVPTFEQKIAKTVAEVR